jgi:hypothetical protein
MTRYPSLLRNVGPLACTLLMLLMDAWRFLRLCLRPSPGPVVEDIFLRKQLALYQERQIKPRRTTHATRMALIWLARWFNWRQAIVIVQPATLIRWHRQGFRVFWLWKSRSGRPPIPVDLQALIRRMAWDNPSWGEERIANELVRKLGLRVSTLRRECLDFLIPLTQHHLWYFLNEWVPHYNAGRPHMALGPGIPQPPPWLPVPLQAHQHRIPEHLRVVTCPILGGLHHEYGLGENAA